MSVNFISQNSNSAFNELEVYKAQPKNTSTSQLEGILKSTNTLRQGIELRTSADFYATSQMKIWSGRVLSNGIIEQGSREEEVLSFGQIPSFTTLLGRASFVEQEIKFDPVLYILQPELYPYPIQLNGGLPGQVANIIEAFPIPFRRPSIEQGYYAKGIHGFLDCGPQTSLGKGNQPISQILLETSSDVNNPFLDSGQINFGGINIPGYKLYRDSFVQAFTEKENNSDYKKITSADVSFQNALSVLDYSRDSDIRKTFEVKSSTAGYTVGNNIYNQSGIGGISYSNRMRGT